MSKPSQADRDAFFDWIDTRESEDYEIEPQEAFCAGVMVERRKWEPVAEEIRALRKRLEGIQ